jgi:hypothetical protein
MSKHVGNRRVASGGAETKAQNEATCRSTRSRSVVWFIGAAEASPTSRLGERVGVDKGLIAGSGMRKSESAETGVSVGLPRGGRREAGEA